MFSSIEDVVERFAKNNYIASRRIATVIYLASEMRKLDAYEKEMLVAPDQQISLTDPDSRSMATSGRGVMQSYGAGQALADLIANGKYSTFDATALSRDRFDRNEQVWEELHI